MLNILRKTLTTLISTSSNRDELVIAQNIIDLLSNKYTLKECESPNVRDFYLFENKSSVRFYKTWKIYNESNSFTLCLVKYSYNMYTVGSEGSKSRTEISFQFYGQNYLNKNYGRTLIRPSTWEDDLLAIFKPNGIGIKGFPKYNHKYITITNDKNQFIKSINRNILQYLTTKKDITLEFNNYNCLFKQSNYLSLENVIKLCETGLEIDSYFNK